MFNRAVIPKKITKVSRKHLSRSSIAGVTPWILLDFIEHIYYRAPMDKYHWKPFKITYINGSSCWQYSDGRCRTNFWQPSRRSGYLGTIWVDLIKKNWVIFWIIIVARTTKSSGHLTFIERTGHQIWKYIMRVVGISERTLKVIVLKMLYFGGTFSC